MDMYEISSSFYFFKKCLPTLQYFGVLLEYYFSVLRSIQNANMPVLNTPEILWSITRYSSSTRAFQFSTPRVEYYANTSVLHSSIDSQYSCRPLVAIEGDLDKSIANHHSITTATDMRHSILLRDAEKSCFL